MYEHLRNTFSTLLLDRFSVKNVNSIISILDRVAADYDISEKETALAVVDDNIAHLVNTYLASKKLEGLADKSIKSYAGRLRIFFNEVRKMPQDIQTNEVRLFLATYQQRKNISDRTLDKIRQILNTFFAWCVDEEYMAKNPCRNIKGFKYEVKPRHSLTRFQLEKLRRVCKTKRDLALIDVLYSTGCRIAELANMKFSDMDQLNHSIEIIGKGKKHNTVYLNVNAQISLNDYMKERQGDSDYIFVGIRKPYRKMSERSIQHVLEGLQGKVNFKVSPHILRHTSATLALQSGMPITQVQKMLGHSSVATTQIYAETSQEEVEQSHKRYVI